MTGVGDVVTVAKGVRIARRGVHVDPSEPDLSVVDVAPVEIPASDALDARTADGYLWRRLWSLPDRLVLEFVGDVIVEVREADGAIVFDRAVPADVEDHYVLDHVLPLWLARKGEVVIHGGVLTREGQGVVLTGHSGMGKSTLTAFLGQRHWNVGGDDAGILHPGSPVTVEPTYSTMRLTTAATQLLGLPEDAGVLVAGKRRLRVFSKGSGTRRSPLVAIARLVPVPATEDCVFTRRRGAAGMNVLLTNTFHVDLGAGGPLAGMVESLADIAASVVVGDLTVPRGRNGLDAADRVLRELLST